MTFGIFRRRRNCRSYLVCLACFTMGYSIGLFHIIPPGSLEKAPSSSLGRQRKVYPWQLQDGSDVPIHFNEPVIKFKPKSKRDSTLIGGKDSLIKFESSSTLRKVEHIDIERQQPEHDVVEDSESKGLAMKNIPVLKKTPNSVNITYLNKSASARRLRPLPVIPRRVPVRTTKKPDVIDHAKNAALAVGNINATGCPPPLGYAAREEITALFSAPGAGNTWVRHLLQVATGVYTGSVYNDGSIKRKGFLGEGRADRSVIVVKTHEAGKVHITEFHRAVFIYREPYGAMKAEFNRRHAGHTGVMSPASLQEKHKSEMFDILKRWRDSNIIWLLNFTGDMHVAQYSRLKTDLMSEMRDVLKFLHYSPSDAQLGCVEKQSVGSFKRTKQFEVPDGFLKASFFDTMKAFEEDVINAFDRRRQLGLNLSMTPL